MGFSLRADLAAVASVCERQQKAHHDGANGDAGTLLSLIEVRGCG